MICFQIFEVKVQKRPHNPLNSHRWIVFFELISQMFVNVNGAQIVGNCGHSKWETYNKELDRNLKLTTHYSLLRIQEE